MPIQTKISILLGLILISISGIIYYGKTHYDSGYKQATIEAAARTEKLSEEYRKKEQNWIQQAQEKENAAQQAKTKTDAANAKLSFTNDSLRNAISEYKRRIAQITTNPQGAPDKGEIGVDLFAECANSFGELAKETSRLADKNNALIDIASIGR